MFEDIKRIFFIWILLINCNSYAQPDKPDSFAHAFSLKMLRELNAIKIDSVQFFTGIYSFRFRPQSDSGAGIYQGSARMPIQLSTAIKKAIELAYVKHKPEASLLNNEYYLIPVLIQYAESPTDNVQRQLQNSFNFFDHFGDSEGTSLARYVLLQPLSLTPVFFKEGYKEHEGYKKFSEMYKKQEKMQSN